MQNSKKKTVKFYQARIRNGEDVRKRVESISEKTGKKMYAIVEEALSIGLKQLAAEKERIKQEGN